MPPDAPIRVLLVEDHALFRRGLRRLLTEHGFEVVGEAGNGQAGARLAEELAPDVVFMDLHMPVMDGVAATREITARPGAPRILMLTISAEDSDVVDARPGRGTRISATIPLSPVGTPLPRPAEPARTRS